MKTTTEGPKILIPMNAGEIDRAAKDLAGAEIELAAQKQDARDDASTKRKAIKEQQAEVTRLAKEVQTGKREEDAQTDAFADGGTTNDQKGESKKKGGKRGGKR